jgi:hypothetical protein
MPSYRIFKMAIDGHLIGPSEVVRCDSDQEVIAHAKAKLDGLDLEVWDGPRVVIRLKSTEIKAADRQRESR